MKKIIVLILMLMVSQSSWAGNALVFRQDMGEAAFPLTLTNALAEAQSLPASATKTAIVDDVRATRDLMQAITNKDAL